MVSWTVSLSSDYLLLTLRHYSGRFRFQASHFQIAFLNLILDFHSLKFSSLNETQNKKYTVVPLNLCVTLWNPISLSLTHFSFPWHPVLLRYLLRNRFAYLKSNRSSESTQYNSLLYCIQSLCRHQIHPPFSNHSISEYRWSRAPSHMTRVSPF